MGWASGLQAGLQLGRAFKEGQERRAMEEIQKASANEIQDYGTAGTQQIQGLQASGAYDVQAIPGAEGQAPTLRYTPKQGLDLQGDMPAPAGAYIDVAPQKMTEFLGQRYEGGLAPERMESLRTRAMANAISDPRLRQQMLAEATRAEREAQEAPLRLEGLKQQVKLGGQQIETGELTLEEKRQQADANKRSLAFTNYAAANPDMPIKDLKDAAFKEFKFSPKQWQETVATRLQIETGEMDIFKNNVKKKLQGKNLTQLGSLYNSDPDFDDKTDLAIVPGKGGAVTLNFIDKATNKITSTQTFKNEALATEYLNKQATEPETIGSWMMNLRKTESAIEAQGAATRASDATVSLRGAQMKQLNESAENANARADLVEKFEALTPEEQAGAKGQGLIKQFNLLNVKAGGTVPLGTTPKTGGPVKMDDVDKENLRYYRDWLKEPKNDKLPQGQKDAMAARLGVTEFINRGAKGPETGVGSNPYANPTPAAVPAAPAAPAASAPAALSTENTKLLGRAGNSGYNVQLPDGTTQIMSISQLNKLGYQFIGNTGLKPAWYEDLLPRR